MIVQSKQRMVKTMGNHFENVMIKVSGRMVGWLMAPIPYYQDSVAGACATLYITDDLTRRQLKYVINKCFKLLTEKYQYEHQIHLIHPYAIVDKDYEITKNLVFGIKAIKRLFGMVLTDWLRKDVDLKFTVEVYKARRG